MYEIQICVTDEDIENGDRKDGRWCPIALAAKRVFPDLTDLFVGEHTLYYDGLMGKRKVSLPLEASNFVKAFDTVFPRQTPEPFCFDVLDPSFVV